jgi:predicted permease
VQLISILTTACNAILPIILLILFGYYLKRIHFLTDDFAKTANKFVFNVGLFCSLFINVYNIGNLASVKWDFVAYIIAVIVALFFIGMCLAVITTPKISRRGVIMQGVFRSNFAILGLSLASALGGPEAESLASVASAFAIPLFNIFGVFAFVIFTETDDDKGHSVRRAALSVVKNPMILGAFFGFLCLVLREVQSAALGSVVFSIKADLPFLYSAVNSLKSITTPLALVVLGAQFKFSAVKGMFREILSGTLGRIVLAPVVGIGGAILIAKYTDLLNCGVNEFAVLLGLFGSPSAISGAVVAGQMGGDEQLATQIVVWSSIGSVLTVFLLSCVLMALGLLPI